MTVKRKYGVANDKKWAQESADRVSDVTELEGQGQQEAKILGSALSLTTVVLTSEIMILSWPNPQSS